MSSQTSGPLTGAAGGGCAEARLLAVIAVHATAPTARCGSCLRVSFIMITSSVACAFRAWTLKLNMLSDEALARRPPVKPVLARYNHRDFGTSRWQLR